jgi:predicted AAA+ superfamily ATPase
MQKDNVRQGSLLDRVSGYVLANTGNMMSASSIAKVLGHKNNTIVESYLELLCNAFIAYKAEKYDMRKKHFLTSPSKYYCVDVGMRNAILGLSVADIGRMLESVVYIELIRRGYKVSVGSYNDLEIDFTASKGDDIKHIQVAAYLSDDVLAREVRALDMVGDHNEKIIISIGGWHGKIKGIKCKDAAEWLLDDGL